MAAGTMSLTFVPCLVRSQNFSRQSGLQVDLFCPVHLSKGFGHQHFAIGAINRIAKAIPIKVHEVL